MGEAGVCGERQSLKAHRRGRSLNTQGFLLNIFHVILLQPNTDCYRGILEMLLL